MATIKHHQTTPEGKELMARTKEKVTALKSINTQMVGELRRRVKASSYLAYARIVADISSNVEGRRGRHHDENWAPSDYVNDEFPNSDNIANIMARSLHGDDITRTRVTGLAPKAYVPPGERRPRANFLALAAAGAANDPARGHALPVPVQRGAAPRPQGQQARAPPAGQYRRGVLGGRRANLGAPVQHAGNRRNRSPSPRDGAGERVVVDDDGRNRRGRGARGDSPHA